MQTLLVDDDPISVFLTEQLLRRSGHIDAVESFFSPVQALAYLRERLAAGQLPRLILLDLNMPVMDGWAFLDALRPVEAELRGRCTIYILTSSLALSDATRAQDYALVAGLIHKPLDEREIQAMQERAPAGSH